MASKKKFYVVWEGKQPGIYQEWADAQDQINGWKGARFKSFSTLETATEAFRKGSDDNLEAIATMLLQAREEREKKKAEPSLPTWMTNPAVDRTAIAVDASCQGNPGRMEYRGVDLHTGKEIFRIGPFEDATNNIGEYLALVHVLALCARHGINRPVYSDSRTAMSWLRRRHSHTSLAPTRRNGKVLELLARADAWVASHSWPNKVMKWDTDHWGEIPADFGRK